MSDTTTLRSLEEGAESELDSWLEDNPDSGENEASERISEIADNWVPVYNSERLYVALSSSALAATPPSDPGLVGEDASAVDILGIVILEHLQGYLGTCFEQWKERRDDANTDIEDAGMDADLPPGYTIMSSGPALGTFTLQVYRDKDVEDVLVLNNVVLTLPEGTPEGEKIELETAIERLEYAALEDMKTLRAAEILHIQNVLVGGYTIEAEDDENNPGKFDLVLLDKDGGEVIRESSEMEAIKADLSRLRVVALNDEDTTKKS